MLVIFLDFDGVLNSKRYIEANNAYGICLDPVCLKYLKEIVDKTGAKIVLTTSWREHWDKDEKLCDETGVLINKTFNSIGLEIFDKTPYLNLRREHEIKAWLDNTPQVDNFLVLDDMLLGADFLKGHFIKTSYYIGGLNEEHIKGSICILNEKRS